MLKLGQNNKLKVLRRTSVGLYLGDEEGNDVLLPNKYVLPEYELDQEVDVFVYKDYEQRWIATNLIPYAKLGEFAFLKARSVTEHGAFLMWGLEKDLFVPFREQKQKMEAYHSYVVFIAEDPETQRLIASAKINKYVSNEALTVEPGELVNLLIFETTPLGFNAIINHKHKGLIYHNEIFQNIQIGDSLQGYIKTIREDNSIDLSLQPKGIVRLEEGAEKIMTYLKSHKGFLALTDSSTPEEITRLLKMSKKNFKKSVGILYKQRLIVIEENGIRLV